MPTLQSKVAFRPDRLPHQIIRALWYVVTETTVVLTAATLSRRLILADQAWSLMVAGIALGLLLAIVGGLLGRLNVDLLPRALFIPGVLLLSTIGTCVILGLTVPHLSLGVVGSVVIGFIGAAVGLIPYFVFDAPDVSPHA